MTEEGRQAYNAYIRAWAKAHPENIKRTKERYWAKKAAEQKASGGERGNDDIRAPDGGDGERKDG